MAWCNITGRWYPWFAGMVAIASVMVYSLMSRPVFDEPCCTVLYDRQGVLLGARISADHQWRFPESAVVPDKFRVALLHYEDRWFYYHPGFNPIAMGRALRLNILKGKVVSGGSTITMQVIRLARKNRPRTIAEKFREVALAWSLELTRPKGEILALYASHAPFGGNVVGLEAASWRYFGKGSSKLSWAEAATLAVLPNSPGLIYPGRNPESLRLKRNRLLKTLARRGVIDEVTCELAEAEPLPGKPLPLPAHAPHLLSRAIGEGYGRIRVTTTIDGRLQLRINEIVAGHAPLLQANGVHNAAVVVASVVTGEVLAYIGNMPVLEQGTYGGDVDIVMAPRSTGSILKPFLYAAMLSDGLILPHTLIPDIPTQIGGFIPENFNRTFDGAVPASEALARSLNIPAVKMLQVYGYRQFYLLLRRAGLTTLKKPADYYGLALILGGAEARLWDLTAVYASMARSLHVSEQADPGTSLPFFPLHYVIPKRTGKELPVSARSPFDPAAVWFTLDAMVEVARPGDELQWRQFSSSRRIAWKTGTSFGNRDAWAIGVTPEFIAGVWIGNASGEGKSGLTGIRAAAPLLMEVFRALPEGGWFEKPDSSMMQVEVCRRSGCRASGLCDEKEMAWIPKAGARSAACQYHQLAHLDSSGRWQVTAACADPSSIRHLPWFVLPPVQEFYYRNRDPLYRVLPPYLPGCDPGNARRNMEIIYPNRNSVVYIPTDLDGRPGSTVFRLSHRFDDVTVYWHLDDAFLAATRIVHQVAAAPGRGNHTLTVTDQNGETLSLNFEVINERNQGTSNESGPR